MIGRALLPGGPGLFIAGTLAALIGLTALLAALRWPAWAPSAPIAATVRVLNPADADGVSRAVAALTALDQVRRAEAMAPERASELLTAWSGAGAADMDLAGLALIEVDLAPGADPARLEAALASAGITADVFAPPMATRVDAAIIGALALIGAVVGCAIFLAAAIARLGPSASALATLAHLGAAPGRVAAAAAWPGLRWGLICAGLAAPFALAALSLASPGAALAGDILLAALAGGLALAALAGVSAALAARIGYAKALREATP
jgi:hypothetical protein